MLTEVLLALAVVGIALTPLFGLQSAMLHGIATLSARIQRLFVLENFLLESRQKFLEQETEQDKQEKTVADPASTVRYEVKKVQGKIFKKLPGLMQEETEATWKEWRSTRSEFMVTLIYKPEKKTKQQKKS